MISFEEKVKRQKVNSIESNKKYSIIRKFFENRTPPYPITLTIARGKSPIKIGTYIFAFKGEGENIEIDSITNQK